MIITIAVAAIMIAYFILNPKIGQMQIVLFFFFWFVSFILDAWLTLANKHLIAKHEQNVLLPVLIQRYGTVPSVTIMFVIEIALMIVIPVIFLRSLAFESIVICALAFGVAHILAFISNLKFIETKRREQNNFKDQHSLR